MKHFAAAGILVFLLIITPPVSANETPSEIGGFKLGEHITEYSGIEYSNYLKEVVVNDWYGFRKGIISYGTCAHPGQIVTMRMKYADPSKDFYNELLKKFKKKFGKPAEWNGDAFGIIYSWKWRFVDDNNRRVSLTLQHNLQNDSQNIGNMVKLSLPELVEEERLCFIRFCEENKSAEEQEKIKERMQPDWDYMIPR